MTTSLWIAKLAGPILLVASFGMLVNRKAYIAMAREFVASPALIYLAGILVLTAGLAITISHNVWVMGWPVIVTIFGWLAVVGGFFRMAFPDVAARLGTSMIEKHSGLLPVSTLVVALLGAVLTWYGYMV